MGKHRKSKKRKTKPVSNGRGRGKMVRQAIIDARPELCIGQKVHVEGFRKEAFFTLKRLSEGKAYLSYNRDKPVRFIVSSERCYLTEMAFDWVMKAVENYNYRKPE